jgi:D-alanine-D-alanine ligase/UDP-N-acetylmuramate--alanine ligase
MKVGIIHGGSSTEQVISTLNARYIAEALSRRGHQVELIFYDLTMIEKLRKAPPDVVFLCVQGKGHGDGTLQAILDFHNIPYTGSRTLAAAIINDKIICKRLFEQAGIRTPPWQVLSLADYQRGNYDFSSIGYPLVAKAPSQGGSFGIELVKSPEDLAKIAAVFAYDDPILIERFISGPFMTVGLLRREGRLLAFPCIEGISAGWGGGMELITFTGAFTTKPAGLSEAAARELEDFSRKAFDVTKARVYARADFIVSSEDGLPYMLEINAVPGLKPSSLFPNGAALCGIDYDDMIEIILRGE